MYKRVQTPENVMGLENEVGTPRQLPFVPKNFRGSYACILTVAVQYVVYIVSNFMLAHPTAKMRSSVLATTGTLATQGAASLQLQSRPEVDHSLNWAPAGE